MIVSIAGIVAEVGARAATIDTGGVGYRVYATNDTLHTLRVGARVRLLTHHSVREDSEELFGFINADELRLFELLITIPGIGPKTALNILNVAPAETLRRSIRSGETAYLTKISGIGKKTADKIILELREKLGAGEETGLAEEVDALEALTALGYSQTQARDALKKVSPAITGASERIKHALKSLGK